MKYTICAIIKDELRYLEEWIMHNLSIGFTDIHLYEDDNSESHKFITDKYENVYLHSINEIDNKGLNLNHQQDVILYFIRMYKSLYDWCALIDPDEFIMFDNDYTLEKLLTEYSDCNNIRIWWKMYNADGHICSPDGNLVDNYKTWKYPVFNYEAWNYKSILNLHNNIQCLGNVHDFKNGVFLNRGTDCKTPYYEKCWINHYFTKSYEDWMFRFYKRGDVMPHNRQINHFYFFNEEMRPLIDKLPKNIYLILFPTLWKEYVKSILI